MVPQMPRALVCANLTSTGVPSRSQPPPLLTVTTAIITPPHPTAILFHVPPSSYTRIYVPGRPLTRAVCCCLVLAQSAALNHPHHPCESHKALIAAGAQLYTYTGATVLRGCGFFRPGCAATATQAARGLEVATEPELLFAYAKSSGGWVLLVSSLQTKEAIFGELIGSA